MRNFWNIALASIVLFAASRLGVADEGLAKIAEPAVQYRTMVDRAVEYLKVRGQASDGSFSGAVGVGPTGLVVSSLASVGATADDPTVAKAIKYLLANVQPDGGIYKPDSKHRNYDTCLAMVALASVNKNGKFYKAVKKAEAFVRDIQWDESEGKEKSDSFYGGAGYGSSERPDI